MINGKEHKYKHKTVYWYLTLIQSTEFLNLIIQLIVLSVSVFSKMTILICSSKRASKYLYRRPHCSDDLTLLHENIVSV